jgi:hypothetical protein
VSGRPLEISRRQRWLPFCFVNSAVQNARGDLSEPQHARMTPHTSLVTSGNLNSVKLQACNYAHAPTGKDSKIKSQDSTPQPETEVGLTDAQLSEAAEPRLAESAAKLFDSQLGGAATLRLAESTAKLMESQLGGSTLGLAESTAKILDSQLGGAATLRLAESAAKLFDSQLGGMATMDLAAALGGLAYVRDPIEEAAADSAAISPRHGKLTREQERLMLGHTAYAIVWLLILQILVDEVNAHGIIALAIGLGLNMTGISGHSLGVRARDLTFKAYESAYPPPE